MITLVIGTVGIVGGLIYCYCKQRRNQEENRSTELIDSKKEKLNLDEPEGGSDNRQQMHPNRFSDDEIFINESPKNRQKVKIFNDVTFYRYLFKTKVILRVFSGKKPFIIQSTAFKK